MRYLVSEGAGRNFLEHNNEQTELNSKERLYKKLLEELELEEVIKCKTLPRCVAGTRAVDGCEVLMRFATAKL
jgi:hypothetical protein